VATASAVHLLRQKYTTVSAVFSSRKALVADVETALEAGALDVLIKPHRSLDNAEVGRIREILAAYCEGRGLGWRRQLA
jgi:CheY-like chemotaxis protein